jgi:hypothetical protein
MADVEAAITKALAKLPVPSGQSSAVVSTGQAEVTFDTSVCVPADEIRKAKTFVLTKGQEICDSDGSLLTTYEGVDPNAAYFRNPSTGQWYCSKGNTCQFNWMSGRKFYIERVKEDGGKTFAMFRFEQ